MAVGKKVNVAKPLSDRRHAHSADRVHPRHKEERYTVKMSDLSSSYLQSCFKLDRNCVRSCFIAVMDIFFLKIKMVSFLRVTGGVQIASPLQGHAGTTSQHSYSNCNSRMLQYFWSNCVFLYIL